MVSFSYTIDKIDNAQFLFPVATYAALIPYLVVSIVDMIGVSIAGCTVLKLPSTRIHH